MTENTLYVRVESSDDFFDDTAAALQQYEEHGAVPDERFVLSFESLSTLLTVFRETNLALLNVIAKHEPESMREAARLVDRAAPNVKANLDELEVHGLIEYEEHGGAKRPVIWYDSLAIDVDIDLPDDRMTHPSESPA